MTLGAAAAVTVAFALCVYHHRWLADDGLIVARTVRELLAGHGPTFNAFERAEADTCTLWTYVVAAATWLSSGDAAPISVLVGAIFAVASVPLAIDATRRWQRSLGVTAPLVPFGILVVIGISPFWDFATSGLETGLSMFWLALVWRMLVALPSQSRRVEWIAAFVFGLGPLVRPDFAIVSVVAFATQIAMSWPGWRAVLARLAAALAVPVAYELFRAGYYGTLVPLPALAKSASAVQWQYGLTYVREFAGPYVVTVPVVLGAGLLVIGLWRTRLARRDRLVLAAPLVSAALLLFFVIRVGGDFMHARMCLPPLFLAAMPGAVAPLRRRTALVLGAMLVWSVGSAKWSRRLPQPSGTLPYIEDERIGYMSWTQDRHPDEAAYLRAEAGVVTEIASVRRGGQRRLISEGGLDLPLTPGVPADLAIAVGRLGAGSIAAPLDAIVVDTLGLANPLGARITPTDQGMAGHEKSLPLDWVVGDFSAQGGTSSAAVDAARHALSCGALAELLASAREPMSWSRFWKNVAGAWARTRLVVPSDPIDAEAAFCPDHPTRYRVSASSSYEADGWSLAYVVDGKTRSSPSALGFSTIKPAPQWLVVDLGRWNLVSAVVLDPRTDDGAPGQGVPIDFEIQTWNGVAWVTQLTLTEHHHDGTMPDSFALPSSIFTNRIRIYATRLAKLGRDEVFQLAEIEVR